MQTKGAIFWPGEELKWSVEPIEIDEPHEGEVLIKMEAAGLCHSDYHYIAGDAFSEHPILGGHEGAGVVAAGRQGRDLGSAGRSRDHDVHALVRALSVVP